MKVSLITVCFNSGSTIEDTLRSVAAQTYNDIEHIIIDGSSTDDTVNIVNEYSSDWSYFISEQDEGLYHAINKGISISSGDIIGILHADDVFFNDSVIEDLVSHFDSHIDGVYGDVVFCKKNNLREITRIYSSESANYLNLKRGIMPAHPSVYLRRDCFNKIGLYRLDFTIASDFDFIVRLFSRPDIKVKYINKIMVKMREGGISTSGIRARFILNKEIYSSLNEHGIKSNYLWIVSKYPMKIWWMIKAKIRRWDF